MKINEVGTLNSQGKPGGQENLGIQQTLDQVCLVQECPERHETRTDPRTKLMDHWSTFTMKQKLIDILSVCTYRIMCVCMIHIYINVNYM